MKSPREFESAICEGMRRFAQDFMGRGPSQIEVHLIGVVLVVRLQRALTRAEQHLVQILPPENGRDLLKHSRKQLIEASRPLMEAMVQEVTGVKMVSLHHDISTVTGEEIIVCTLDNSPCRRFL